MNGAPMQSSLKPVFHQYAYTDEIMDQLITDFRCDIVAISAQLWLHFELPFSTWPFVLLLLVDERHTEEPIAVARRFWSDHHCNKDPWFSSKLMHLFRTPEEMCSDECFLSALKAWGSTAKVTNMHVERILARMKKATPEKLPSVERMLAAGNVSEWLRRHMANQGADPRVHSRRQLVQAGTPLKCGVSQAQTMRGGLRPAIAYANKKLHEERERGTCFTAADRCNRQRELVTEFAMLPSEQKHGTSKLPPTAE